MGAIRFDVSGYLLLQALEMPIHLVVNARMSGYDRIELTLVGEDFPDVPEGGEPLVVQPEATRQDDGSVVWNWNLPEWETIT